MALGSHGLRSRADGRAELTFSAGRGGPACTSAETEKSFCAGRVHQSRTRALRAQSHLRSDVLLHLLLAIDWSGIHTAFITCTFIALESTGATLHKGVLRIGGCVIGGALALFTIVFLMPHMETIASLVVVVACASAIAGWVAAGSELISYGGLQIAFAFFYSVFQGYAPDTDLDNVRDRVVGILFGLIVTGLVFRYIWPEHTIDRLRAALRAALRQLARLLEIPRPESSIETAKAEAHRLIGETSKSFDQARRYVELTQFESEESSATDQSINE